ncbi:MAG: hypothetical protein IMY85_08935 [Chloroflexi bacterium]|nr:hypothetical protein [Chloroflexota bacterium]
MKYTIFYSWQSDLPNSTNRGFIQKALENVAKSIRKDGSIDVEPVVDRDTQGISGSPDIAATIFKKIEKCQVFVPDVSIINPETEARPSPNPNVLIELGYAIKILDWERIIMVMNTVFGNPEDLPFDLLKKRVLTYKMPEDVSERATERKRIEASLREGLELILGTQGDAQSTMLPFTLKESLDFANEKQKVPSGEILYYYSPEQRDKILELFPKKFNKAKEGKAAASSQYKTREPQYILKGNRLDIDWCLNEESGWLEVIWEDPIKGRYLLLSNRRSNTPGKDPWGPAGVIINDNEIARLEEKFAGSYVLVIDLSKPIEISRFRCKIKGNVFPGLSGLEVY